MTIRLRRSQVRKNRYLHGLTPHAHTHLALFSQVHFLIGKSSCCESVDPLFLPSPSLLPFDISPGPTDTILRKVLAMKGVSTDARSPVAMGFPALFALRVTTVLCTVVAGTALVISPNFWSESRLLAQSRDETVRFPTDDEPLVDVRVEGNTTIPADTIAEHIKTRPGRPADDAQIRQDIRSLYGTKWFFDVARRYRRTDKGLVLIFKVVEKPVLKKVEYLGNKKIKTKVLAAHTGLKEGGAFDVSANRESARRLEDLYHEKGHAFATVDLEKGDAREDREVIFRIAEGPKVRVTSIKFEGNEFFSGPLLMTKLRTKRAILWTMGGKYDPATIPDDVVALKQYYQSVGFFDVQIEDKVEFNANRSRARIRYVIYEGLRTKIRRVEIEGNNLFTTDELNKDFSLVSGDHFNARKLTKDVANIKNKYGELGRLMATVDAVPRFLEQPGEVDLVYRIDEDREIFVGRINVHIRGEHPHTQESVVLNQMKIAPGDRANPRLINLSKTRIGGAQIFERTQPNGPRINVSQVRPLDDPSPLQMVRGQSASQPNRPYVRRQVLRHPSNQQQTSGVPRRQSDVRRPPPRPAGNKTTEVHLPFDDPGNTSPCFYVRSGSYNIGGEAATIRGQNYDNGLPNPSNPLFENSPQGDPFGDPTNSLPPGVVDLDVYVTEARTGRLMFGVGVNSDAGVVGSIVLSEQNFDILRPPTSFRDIANGTAWRGGGQRFRMEAIPGSVVSRYMINWTDPYFLDTNYSLGVSGFFYNRFFDDWDEQRTGGRITVGNQLTPYTSISGTIRGEEVVISNPAFPTPPSLTAALGSNLLSTGRFAVAHDTRDSAFLPGAGHLIELNYEQAVGDFDYPRAGAEARQFFTLYSRPDGGGRHTLSIGGEVGWTDSGTPIFERYFAGGFQTFRGFEFRGISPRVGPNGVGVGGQWLALGSVEYMLPLMANESIHGVVFSDFGTVESDVGLDDFRATAGFGLRVTVPAMGPVPLAFDFAFPLVDQVGDETQVFSFYIGLTR